MTRAHRISRDRAEEIAVMALAHIASRPDLLGRYLDLTGLRPDGLRKAATEPGFLAGTLAFLLAHEPDLFDFAEAAELHPEEIAEAARQLGANEVHQEG
ncbi:hypothetical protein J2R99_003128 [Rhodopseudomonas julia]|uniref:DUF3572 family protein n=1 Tax=Rhodopseudomonas julia TaxID=200617 RepID=A0ABU0C9U9_9BRAD|nr:DUF3572 domain-containing protein [Rhodopseudomonas julia]MDQ0327259.1 hypothetical protein [Rhodopseudomonas julia]